MKYLVRTTVSDEREFTDREKAFRYAVSLESITGRRAWFRIEGEDGFPPEYSDHDREVIAKSQPVTGPVSIIRIAKEIQESFENIIKRTDGTDPLVQEPGPRHGHS